MGCVAPPHTDNIAASCHAQAANARESRRHTHNLGSKGLLGMDFSQWLTLVSICLLGAMSPGPSLAVVVGCVVKEGQAGGIRAAIAHAAGVALYGLLTVTGLALLITQTPAVYTALQVAGAAYLLFLGGKALYALLLPADDGAEVATGNTAATQGFLVAFLNPKLAVFMLALFSQFLEPGFGVREKGIMVATVGVTDAVWYCLVATLLSRGGFRSRLERSAKIIDGIFGVILILLALSVLYAALG